VLVGAETPGSPWKVEDSLNELEQLALTADVEAVGRVTQKLSAPNPKTFVGKGKVEEVRQICVETDATVVLFDDELSPGQGRNLEDALGRMVVDRTALILDIFARRARTREGRLQVELAQLEYRLPRLTRMWSHLSRQAVGGVGLRGPGETQLEVDRRQARERITHIKEEIEHVRRQRRVSRERRRSEGFPVVALVGYTNAGKSTLLNALSGSDVTTEDKLFATLDPTTRQVQTTSSGGVALWTDTVGFIQKLPTGLVAAFRATLEEINDADVLVHVIDITHPNADEQAAAVRETLKALGADEKQVVYALNKSDRLAPDGAHALAQLELQMPDGYVSISASEGWGLSDLLERVQQILDQDLSEMYVVVPYSQSALVDLFHQRGQVLEESYTEAGTGIHGRIPRRFATMLERYSENGRSDPSVGS